MLIEEGEEVSECLAKLIDPKNTHINMCEKDFNDKKRYLSIPRMILLKQVTGSDTETWLNNTISPKIKYLSSDYILLLRLTTCESTYIAWRRR